ncbi:MAG TPA: ADP-ribosylglycohydrolase family protein [Saprospiraceae bacterium]|nr:ADP-ribosylglycohydrolase family protein [Saprospiraceae bacterium]HRK82189.1 ADP-ribosylglycohydrolase family protein [Saprospiraceae bacterium]
MIIEGAIGDAYGAGFEFADMEFIKNKNQLTHYQQHPLFESIYKKYTDDTQMALAIAELLIEKTAWTPVAIADKFVEVFKRDPRQGYAKGRSRKVDRIFVRPATSKMGIRLARRSGH